MRTAQALSYFVSIPRRLVESFEQALRRDLEDIAHAQNGREGHWPSRLNLLPVSG